MIIENYCVVFYSKHCFTAMIRGMAYSCFVILLTSFISPQQIHYKKLVNNYRFYSLQEEAKPGDYFVIRDSIHQEYSAGKLFTISKVNWLSENRIDAMLRYVTVDLKDGFYSPGDTLKIECLSFRNDTLTLRVNFKDYGYSPELKYLRKPL